MVKIRLARVGRKNDPSFRIVAQDHRVDPRGRYLEVLGHYNPRQKTKSFHKERLLHWLKQGAQPTPTVHNLLVSEGIIKASKIKVTRLRPKKKTKKGVSAAEKKKKPSAKEMPEQKELAGQQQKRVPDQKDSGQRVE